jgi:putative PIN family toxin of toxin-antitoxin system
VVAVTLDSNVYVSALQFSGIGVRLLAMARAGAIRLDTSEVILAETIGVLRDKFGWEGYRLHFAREELRKIANVTIPTQTIQVADDPDDNRIIECAVEAESEFILTNDTDLLRLKQYREIKILRPADFLTAGIDR